MQDILDLIFTGRRKCREVWPDEGLEKGFTLFLDGILLVIPLFIMAAMYGLIVNHLWKVDQGKNRLRQSTKTRSPNHEYKVILSPSHYIILNYFLVKAITSRPEQMLLRAKKLMYIFLFFYVKELIQLSMK